MPTGSKSDKNAKPIDPEMTTNDGPLHIAAEHGQVKIIEFLFFSNVIMEGKNG